MNEKHKDQRQNKIVLKLVSIGYFTYYYILGYALLILMIAFIISLCHVVLPAPYDQLLRDLPKSPYENSIQALTMGSVGAAIYITVVLIYTFPIVFIFYSISLLLMAFLPTNPLLLKEIQR